MIKSDYLWSLMVTYDHLGPLMINCDYGRSSVAWGSVPSLDPGIAGFVSGT